MSASQRVDDDGFRMWMTPKVEAIRVFATAVRDLGDLSGRPPGDSSRAMQEIAEGAGYASRSFWKDPVHDAHTFGGLALLAVSDYAHGFSDLFAGPRVPLYSYLALARPALEAAVVAAWLNEPGISTLGRIKRALCEQLYSANEVNRLKISDDADQHLADWQKAAADFGWETVFDRGRPVVDGTKRPGTAAGLNDLIGSGDAPRVGNLLFSRLSAVTHVTWFGLQWALDIDSAETNKSTRIGSVPVGTDSQRVSSIASYVVRALRQAATARVTLMGWDDERWGQAREAATRLELELLQTAITHAGNAPTPAAE